MKIALTTAQLAQLKSFLSSFEDSEQLSETEFVLDLYDLEPPLSIDLVLDKNALIVDGAAELKFDDEMDGWYIGDRIESPDRILDALKAVGALSE